MSNQQFLFIIESILQIIRGNTKEDAERKITELIEKVSPTHTKED